MNCVLLGIHAIFMYIITQNVARNKTELNSVLIIYYIPKNI